MKVIAEGVENQSQFEALQSLECDYVQGYLIAKPMSVAAIDDLIAEGNTGFNPELEENKGVVSIV